MKITQIEIRQFRSITIGDQSQPLVLSLSSGVNALVGPNNSGKSNIIRSLTLALDRSISFDPDTDLPNFIGKGQSTSIKPTIEVELSLSRRGSKENTLSNHLRKLQAARQGLQTQEVLPPKTVRLRVRFARINGEWARDEDFLFGEEPKFKEIDPLILKRALDAFYGCIYYAHIPAGVTELPSSLWEMVYDGMDTSSNATRRATEHLLHDFQSMLSGDLIGPLNSELTHHLSQIFPEVRQARLSIPEISLQQLLKQASIEIIDSSSSDLSSKGSGIRSGYFLGILGYLASSIPKSRSLIMTLDEPETFLHPKAQAEMMAQLDALARGLNVSLVYSTHSQYAISNIPESTTFGIDKSESGSTHLVDTCSGDNHPSKLLGNLFIGGEWTDALVNMDKVSATSNAVVIVEGRSDVAYLRGAVRSLRRKEFWDNIDILHVDGAKQVPVVAVLTAALHYPKPVIVLLDDDRNPSNSKVIPLSEKAYKILAGDLTGFTSKLELRQSKDMKHRLNGHVAYVWEAFGPTPIQPFDVEDFFPETAYLRFSKATGTPGVESSADVNTSELKKKFSQWIESNGTPSEFKQVSLLLNSLEQRIKTLLDRV